MTGAHHPARPQSGFAILGIAVVAGALALAFVLAQSAWSARRALDVSERERGARLDEAAAMVAAWYERRAGDVDRSDDFPFQPATVLSEAGVPMRWGLALAVGNRVREGPIAYRRLTLWDSAAAPAAAPAGAGSGAGLPASRRDVDGRAIQGRAYAATLSGMRRLARALELRFKARTLMDSDHRLDRNHFRPADPGCSAMNDEIPCLDAYTDVRQVNLARLLGMPAEAAVTAWNGPVLANNGADASSAAPPYTMALMALTPWGEPVRVIAVEPVD